MKGGDTIEAPVAVRCYSVCESRIALNRMRQPNLLVPDERPKRILRSLNAMLGLSQEEIAKRLKVSYTTVNAWANGKRMPRDPAIKSMGSLLKAEVLSAAAKGDRLQAVLALLQSAYGAPHLGNKRDPLDELFFILLSLKTSHNTYEDTYSHFKKLFYPWRKLLEATPEEVEAHIRRGGLGSIKARAFIDIAQRLQADFGKVSLRSLEKKETPDAEAYLMSLPGVGLKTARCVLMYSLERDVVPVDTHTYRVGARLGLVATSTSTKSVHAAFDEVVPKGLAYELHTNFVAHGRAVCQDLRPACEKCICRSLCPYPGSRTEGPGSVGDGTKEKQAAAARREPVVHRAGERRRLAAVDVFSGCGGLSAGLKEGGFDVRYALDWDENACATHRLNFPDTVTDCADVRTIGGERVLGITGGPVDLVAGGPNCQGVSQRGLRNPDDPRNFMLPEFVRLVSDLRPRAFLMENVPGLAHRHNYLFLKHIFETFERLGYRCAADVLLAAEYGVPQLRYRFFLIGTLDGLDLTFPAPTHRSSPESTFFERSFPTVWEAIGDLPEISADHQKDVPLAYTCPPSNTYQAYVREGTAKVRNHVCSATQEINLLRASHIPEGGNWKDIPPSLLPPRLFTCRMTDHSTTYGRLRRDQPAFTITSLFGNITAGAFTHPLITRALSVREGARIQSFPDRFEFAGARNSMYRQIGNAVPPLLARAVASHLRSLLEGERTAGIRPRIDNQLLDDKRAWDALPVLTPRFKALFGTGTRWPKGWGPEPSDYSRMLDDNYSLRSEFVPEGALAARRKAPDQLVLAESFSD